MADDWPDIAFDDDESDGDDMVADLLTDRAIFGYDPSVGYDRDMVEPDDDREPVEIDWSTKGEGETDAH